MELFRIQFASVAVYRSFCANRGVTPKGISRWQQIPAIPTSAFKEADLSSLSTEQRARVFYSSGTTGQRPSRHYHSLDSLGIYEASLVNWFAVHLLEHEPATSTITEFVPDRTRTELALIVLTPGADRAPNSSLIHMFETVRRVFGFRRAAFYGQVDGQGGWTLDLTRVVEELRESVDEMLPALLLGTAFSFVHLLDHLADTGVQFQLPPGSRAMETGGYKGLSRVVPRSALHALIAERLGIAGSNIVSEYGMSELSSQAYDRVAGTRNPQSPEVEPQNTTPTFRFPPWARVQIISPETGLEVADGQTGLIRVLDLANVSSVLAVQTEDLAVRRGPGFTLLGRAPQAERRGCSLMAA